MLWGHKGCSGAVSGDICPYLWPYPGLQILLPQNKARQKGRIPPFQFRFSQAAPITLPLSSTTVPPTVSRREVSQPRALQAVTYMADTTA